jgi:hypothetical protein
MPKQMGELMVDHRASPGLPEDVAIWAGYDPKQVSEGKVYTVATLHCSHCLMRGIPNHFRTRSRAVCFECDSHGGHYICDVCDWERNQPGYVHTPLVKKIDDWRNNIVKMGSPSKLITP